MTQELALIVATVQGFPRSPYMSSFWADLKQRGVDYRTRFLLMHNVLQKIKENNIIIPTTAEVTNIKKLIFQGSVVATVLTLLGIWRVKKLTSKVFVLGLGFTSITMGIKPYYVGEIMDTLAETQTEAGQLIRATFLFKMPKHPNKEHYEKLSEDYRAFTAQKRKELSQEAAS